MAQEAPPVEKDHWHLHDAHELARRHGVDPAHGLHEDEASRRAQQHGPNEIQGRPGRGLWAQFIDQFKDFMVLVLIAAAVISGVIGDLVDTLAILVIVLLNATIGFVQAWRADKAMAALQQLAATHATVLRGGQAQVIASSELVPGDIVLLEAGNQVPADLRLIEIAQLKVDESALTGESVTVEKHAGTLTGLAHALGDRLNMAFKGTTATHGRGRGLVVATGMATELGKVAGLLDRDTDRSTPLQLRLAAFGKRLALAVIAICVVIFLVGVMRGEAPVLMILTAVSLAVAAIPEALPAVVTVLLALGARRMVSLNALIRRLPSVETLGSVTYICTDKTGTLTQNRMHAELLLADGQEWVPGSGAPGRELAGSLHLELLRAAALCNDAGRNREGVWQGDPTETALTQVALEAGLDKAELERQFERVQELPFDSERKRMSTLHRSEAGFIAYTKGAPESVIPLCSTQWHVEGAMPLQQEAVLATAEAMAARGLRVLALASRTHATLPAPGDVESVESGMSLIGLIGLIDPPRPEAALAVRDCQTAGITPVMITGDHPATALAIARRLGIVVDGDAEVLTGSELAVMDEPTLREHVMAVRVYARVDPAQKIRIVEALQARGEFVAMTGDGVNDAPALKRADIGVAMGRGGTDVAREASSLVLLDDNFATIVAAVREGRRIYDNIRKFVRYAMTGNSGEIWTIFLAPMLGLPIPLLPIHILWVNLVTDGLPGLALAAEPAEHGIMQRPPRTPQESLFANGLWQHILWVGLLLGGLCLLVQAWALSTAHAHWQTMVFTVLTLGQMAHVLAIRSEAESLFSLGLGSNKPLIGAVLLTFALQMATIYVPVLNPIFKTQALSLVELMICLAASAVVFFAVEIEKLWLRRKRPALAASLS
ncbi:MAG: cation-translocating P-type ATPase [Rhodoferax sp.]|uniref:cation-translocating P-type ATPase n=1 Tax=Rhodoferax sp. TaxID=50421 RepID=UPI001400A0B0|nr:cation-translocating P-type ATPase [Rhodoferax sp.]NDP38146.1 cation-translocating P-type ATPase [Rhodoferax sp.]